MKLFLSKKEIEILNEDYKNSNHLYTNKEKVITQIFATKVYNLMKEDYDLALNYIDKVLNISSICEDIDLTYFNITDSKILLTMENNILSGFILEKKRKNISSFFNTVKIRNDFIIAIPEKTLKPVILEELLIKSNIKCLNSLCSITNLEINKKIKENLNNIFKYNMYVEYQFRKDEFSKAPLKKDEKNLLISHYIKEKKLKTEPNVEKYIYDMFSERILNYANLHLSTLTKNLKISMSKKILDVDYLYEQSVQDLTGLIIELLNQPIYNSISRKKDLIVLDWLFVKDDISEFIKKKNKEESYKIYFKYKISMINKIYLEIYKDIKSKCEDYDTFSVKYGYSTERICKNKIDKVFNKTININKSTYKCVFIGFFDINDNFFALDNNFNIEDILSLQITYEDNILYSVPEETKNMLTRFNKKLLTIIKDNGYTYTDHSKNKNINDLKIN